jgi:hypothetical protein
MCATALSRIVAKKIIALAKAGEHNPEAIQEEVRNAERVQLEAIDAKRSGMASQSPTRKKEPLRPAVCVR